MSNIGKVVWYVTGLVIIVGLVIVGFGGNFSLDSQNSPAFYVANFIANPKDLLALNGRVANTWTAKISSRIQVPPNL